MSVETERCQLDSSDEIPKEVQLPAQFYHYRWHWDMSVELSDEAKMRVKGLKLPAQSTGPTFDDVKLGNFINFSKFWAQGHPPCKVCLNLGSGTLGIQNLYWHPPFAFNVRPHEEHIYAFFICWMPLCEDVSWRRCQLGMPVGSASCWRCQLTIYMQSVIKKNVLVWAEDTVDEAQVHKQCHVFPAALSGHAFKAVHCFSQDSCKSRLHHFCKSRQEHTAEQNHFSVQAPRVILSS